MRIKYTALFLSLIIFTACSDDNHDINFEVPVDYTFERNGQSTVSFPGQTIRIAMAEELISSMTDFSVTEELLLEMYANQTSGGADADPFSSSILNQSSKSIKSKVAASADFFSANTVESLLVKSDIEAWIVDQVREVFPNRNTMASAGTAGQIADGSSVRYVNARGLEYNQAVAKSLIGALITDQMLNNYLSPAVLDAGDNRDKNDSGISEPGEVYTNMEHKWDEAYGYLFGAVTNPATPLAELGSDGFLNKYLDRVNDDPDFNGIARDIFNAFKLGRAAIVAGDYVTRDEQAGIIRELVSTVIAVRAVYYLQQAKLSLISGGPNGGAFHDLSEGLGFIYSLRFTRQPDLVQPYFTAEEIRGFINDLTNGNGFWDVSPQLLEEISSEIASRFEFTVDQAAT